MTINLIKLMTIIIPDIFHYKKIFDLKQSYINEQHTIRYNK